VPRSTRKRRQQDEHEHDGHVDIVTVEEQPSHTSTQPARDRYRRRMHTAHLVMAMSEQGVDATRQERSIVGQRARVDSNVE